ncbi:MAG TPA: hypothetical protein PLK06_03905 [bacterium]|nr:hypothetical protein [bacterium]
MEDRTSRQDAHWHSLVDLDLTGFHIIMMTEVFETDDRGNRVTVLGHFKDKLIARVFKEAQRSGFTNLQSCNTLVLTNGVTGFILTGEETKQHDEEKLRAELRREELERLTPDQRAILGL